MFRWFSFTILLCAVGTSGYYRWRARQGSETIARVREGNHILAIRILAALLLYLPFIAYVAIPQRMTWASFALPVGFRWLGFLVGLLMIPPAAWVLRSLGHNVSETVLTKQKHQLVMVGPYQWVRHPLCTTGITLLIALGLLEASWFVLLTTTIAALFIRLTVIPAEERALVEKFGERYRTYMGRTGRMLPRVLRSDHRV